MGISFGGGLKTAAAKQAARKAGARGLGLAAEHILGESNKRVPIEEHILEGSGAVSVDEAKLKAAISYNTPYAVEQHEMLQYRHDDGRTAKFLELSMASEAKTATEIIAKTIKGEL